MVLGVQLVGPLVECLVLADRLLFLQERGLRSVTLIPAFDPMVSPRNMVIVALKNDVEVAGTASARARAEQGL